MKRLPLSLSIGLLLTVGSAAEEQVSFQTQIRPILSDRCFKCHGPDAKNQKSDFRLDTEEHAHADLGGYFGIVPGNLEDSEVSYLIHSYDEDEMMPPPDSNLALTEEEKELIDTWILQGAKYEKHWSFVPIADEIEVPDAGGDWARNEIDRFVARKHEQNGVTPAPEAPKSKWLRRASFDLTGLPPTVEEIDNFENDDSEDAYEKVVDRLLASNAYAERMTAEWLDVARYSDSYGYQRDDERFVWPWRDWVLQAFRDNKPYDEFITEQIAGDLLPGATDEQRLATAFNRLHGHCMEGGSVPEEFRCEYVADRTETVGTAFLGLTMSCTKCHDHKYDPLTARDFYSMSAFFANIDEAGLIAYFTEAAPTPAMSLATDADKAELRKLEKQIQKAEKEVREIASKADLVSWLKNEPTDSLSKDLAVHLSFEEIVPLDDKKGALINKASPINEGMTKLLNVLEDGYRGKAIRVTGDDEVGVPNVGKFDRDQPWSASIWVNVSESAPRANILSRGKGADDSAGMGYEFLLIEGKPTLSLAHFWPGNAIRIQAKDSVPVGEWTHLGASYDGSSKASGLKIYINGQLAETEVIRDHLTRTIDKFRRIYDDKNQEYMGLLLGQRFRDVGLRNGLIDEFRFWTRQVSDLEMQQVYDGERLTNLLAKSPDELTGDERTLLKEHFVQVEHEPTVQAREKLREARKRWNDKMDSIPAVSVMEELDEPRKTHILERGLYDSKGEEVTPETPAFLPPMDPDLPKNRLGFAKWLTDPGNPLTSRVTVNRYWQMIFGKGIVATSEDFGVQSTPPTHPELLDWLSRDFMEHGWDVKRLLKMMVLSATYRQSTETSPEMREKDPENHLLARSHTTRLEAEMIRDNALATSGLLVDKWGGPTAKPYQVEVSFNPVKADQGGRALPEKRLYMVEA